jgi:hypothetical protein
MDRRIISLVLALVMIGGMFLPFMEFGFGGSTTLFDLLTSKGGDWEKYIGLLIPISALMLIIGAVNKDNYFISRIIWSILPLLTILYYPVRLYLEATKGGGSVSITDLIQVFVAGYWVIFGAALLLAVIQPRSRFA